MTNRIWHSLFGRGLVESVDNFGTTGKKPSNQALLDFLLPLGQHLVGEQLAVGRGGIKTVLIPEENVKDLAEIPDEIKNRLDIHPVRCIEQVLEKALERQPTALPEEKEASDAPPVPPAPGADDKTPVLKH